MNARAIPAAVSKRKRIILATDIAVAAVVFSVALHFVQPGISNLLWMVGGIAATLGTLALRRSIDAADLPTAELDEYELKRHLEAREDGLRWSLGLSMLTFLLTGVVAFAARFWVDLDGQSVALFFAKVVFAQIVWVPFAMARSLAGKISRDELISGE